jgi:hypothetical protein
MSKPKKSPVHGQLSIEIAKSKGILHGKMMMARIIQKTQQLSFGTITMWERLFSPTRRYGKMPLTRDWDSKAASS